MVAPSVSVLMPFKNAAEHLPAALDSILAQSLTNFELVAVDDGSQDDSAAQLQTYAHKDSRVRLLQPGAQGLIAALNLGLASCRAPYVARMDADDLMHPERLQRQLQRFDETPDLALVSSRVHCFREGELQRGYQAYECWANAAVTHEEILRELYIESPLPHPSVMFRRKAVHALKGYRDQGWPEDYDLWLRMAHAGHRFAKVPAVLLEWRDHDQRHSRTHGRYSDEAFLRCKAHHLAQGPLAARPAIVWGAGKLGRRLAKHLRDEGATLLGFIDIDPRKLGRCLHGLPIASPETAAPGARALILTAVRTLGARDLIRARLYAKGCQEGRDFICAA